MSDGGIAQVAPLDVLPSLSPTEEAPLTSDTEAGVSELPCTGVLGAGAGAPELPMQVAAAVAHSTNSAQETLTEHWNFCCCTPRAMETHDSPCQHHD